MPVLVFCCFLFQKSCSGNILGIGRNKSPWSYFSVTYTKSEGETKTGTEAATPGGGTAPPPGAPLHGVGPSGLHRCRPLAYKFIYSGNPRYPSHYPRKVPEPPPPSTLTQEGSEALPGTLPERGIITGGLYIAMPASRVMRE